MGVIFEITAGRAYASTNWTMGMQVPKIYNESMLIDKSLCYLMSWTSVYEVHVIMLRSLYVYRHILGIREENGKFALVKSFPDLSIYE